MTDRFEEAKRWYRRALELQEQTDTSSGAYSVYLSNLADLLVLEVEGGRTRDASAQLVEAQCYLEQALVIDERLNSSNLWRGYNILARIANRQGRIEAAQDYRRREREAYAAFAGHRFHIDQQFGSRLPVFVAAQDNLEVRTQVEETLPQLEAQGRHLTEALHRLWAGERDWHQIFGRIG